AAPRPRLGDDRRRRGRAPRVDRRRHHVTVTSLDQIDLLEDTWAREVPHDQFALLRREAPVFWHDHPNAKGFWAITKHADVKAVSHDVATFSTEVGSAFILDQDPEALEFHRMTLLQMDPPKHNRYRRLVSAGFTPRMIGLMADSIAARAARIAESVRDRDVVEFTSQVRSAQPVPPAGVGRVHTADDRVDGGFDRRAGGEDRRVGPRP